MQVEEPLLKEGAARFGADHDSFTSLGGTDGAVYRCRKGSRAYVMKFVPLTNVKEPNYREKIDFVTYLYENGIPIASPVESMRGERVERIEWEPHSYLVTLMPLADGRHPQPRNLYDWNERLFETWGKVMGRMHALTQSYPCWENESGSPPTEIEGWKEEFQFFVDWCADPRIKAKWMELYPLLEVLPRDRTNYGLVHNDLHQFNFFYNPDAREAHPITIIDFDVCAYQWFIADIAIAVYHAAANGTGEKITERRNKSRAFLTHFMRGYRQENTLDETWLAHLPLFMKYREILLYIALINSWSESERQKPWNKRWLSEKRTRTLKDEAII
jgi:Ser/Thr protein kinase RdoA (MazF antagonist)